MQQHMAEICSVWHLVCCSFYFGQKDSQRPAPEEPKTFLNTGFILDWMSFLSFSLFLPNFLLSNNEQLVKAWSIVTEVNVWSRVPGARWQLQPRVQQDQGDVKIDTGLHRHRHSWSSPFISKCICCQPSQPKCALMCLFVHAHTCVFSSVCKFQGVAKCWESRGSISSQWGAAARLWSDESVRLKKKKKRAQLETLLPPNHNWLPAENSRRN